MEDKACKSKIFIVVLDSSWSDRDQQSTCQFGQKYHYKCRYYTIT